MRVPYDKMVAEFNRVLLKIGFTPERADVAAHLFADASRDGVYTHGLNRFPRFISNIQDGWIDINAEPELISQVGAVARYDGHHGPGNLNAKICVEKAMEIADQYGVGVVALGRSNHWMRPGTYGLEAAEKGYIAIMWTNTIPNLPAWGSKEPRLGNNPIVYAVPTRKGPVLLDCAMSMFSYGKLESYAREGKDLPVDGGYGKDGKVTRNAAEVMETAQSLPIGFWKGSGMSVALDLIATMLSGGLSVKEIGEQGVEANLSQVFIMIRTDLFGDKEAMLDKIDATLQNIEDSAPRNEGVKVRWPGQGMARIREENMKLGIPVEETYWKMVCEM